MPVDQYGNPQYRYEVEVITTDGNEKRFTYHQRTVANIKFWAVRQHWGKKGAEVALHDLKEGKTLKTSIGTNPVEYPSGTYHHTQVRRG